MYVTDRNFQHDLDPGGTPLCDLNGDVPPNRVWFSGCFVLNGVSISSLSVFLFHSTGCDFGLNVIERA